MDAPVYKDAEQALKVAKITLMMAKNTVAYTTTIFSMKQQITEDIPTAATDGKHLLINPDFFMKLTPNERLTLLAHEALHVLLDHMHRKGERDHKLWNIAGDYVINGSLVNAQYALPTSGLHDTKYNGMTTEQVYDILNKKSDQQKQDLFDKCKDGVMNGNDITYPDKDDPNAVTQDEVTSIILRAITQAKAMGQEPGSMPGEIEVELQRTLNPPLPWHIILQNYLTEFAKDNFTFRKP
jgi:predicted metal-dependent peptidase